jgi:predicted DCC family thiol-disulfide oxidoreductase YuxK
MNRLYILYDSQCAFCRRCRVWLDRQPAFVPLTFIPLQSPEVGCRFPGIERLEPDKEIVVISDAGDVWQGGAAWVMCLWALYEYREWSQRLAHPALLPFARRACAFVSEHRQQFSRWAISSWSKEEGVDRLRDRLAALPAETCANEGYRKPR